jgi:hypothetical protein
MKKYYSIRVVEAGSLDEAIEKVDFAEFCEDDELCDKVMSKKEAYESFNQINGYKKGEVGEFISRGKSGDYMFTDKKDNTIQGLASTYGVKVKTERMYGIKKENAKEVVNLVKITIL